jgi:hypothetical protein
MIKINGNYVITLIDNIEITGKIVESHSGLIGIFDSGGTFVIIPLTSVKYLTDADFEFAMVGLIPVDPDDDNGDSA